MSYNFKEFEKKVSESIDWLKGEYSLISTNKATPLMLDSISIDAYGAKQKINHIANVMIEDQRTLNISPYDKEQIPEIETQIRKAFPDFSISVADTGIRLKTPELTGDRREVLKKVIKDKAEEARASIRVARELVIKDFKQKETNKEISEDEHYTYKDQLQEKIDKSNEELERIKENKLKDTDS